MAFRDLKIQEILHNLATFFFKQDCVSFQLCVGELECNFEKRDTKVSGKISGRVPIHWANFMKTGPDFVIAQNV
jgi:hypothetical protein